MTGPDFIQERTQKTKTSLVWDGGAVMVPDVMGVPLPGRMEGTDGERLTELAGRCCYDSLTQKKARKTPAYHQHILEVGHYSVFRHYTWVIRLKLLTAGDVSHAVMACANRPGVMVCDDPGAPDTLRIKVNAQAALEWDKFSLTGPKLALDPLDATFVREAVVGTAKRLMPQIAAFAGTRLTPRPDYENVGFEIAEPIFDHEKTISLYMCGTRGFSHEQVRHAYDCGISQRSTRYCEESESPWLMHPAIKTFLTENENQASAIDLELAIQNAEGAGRFAYDKIRKTLEPWLTERLPADDAYRASTALKQSRGAARGYLGNALETELIFTASVTQWKRMLGFRAADAADGEICDIFADALTGKPDLGARMEALGALRDSRYADSFAGYNLVSRGDRTGNCLEGGGAR